MKSDRVSLQDSLIMKIFVEAINPLMPGGNKKVAHTSTYSMCDLFVTTRH